MKRIILIFWVISSVMIFFSCQEESVLNPELSKNNQETASLAKPAPKLIGTTNALFNFPPLPDPNDYDNPVVYWQGTITFGETYGLYFISPDEPTPHGQSSHFWEEWVIHEDGFPENAENVYLRGWNEGVVSNANGKFRANGEVTEAYGEFEEWIGRKVHISGIVTTDALGNTVAIGALQIN